MLTKLAILMELACAVTELGLISSSIFYELKGVNVVLSEKLMS